MQAAPAPLEIVTLKPESFPVKPLVPTDCQHLTREASFLLFKGEPYRAESAAELGKKLSTAQDTERDGLAKLLELHEENMEQAQSTMNTFRKKEKPTDDDRVLLQSSVYPASIDNLEWIAAQTHGSAIPEQKAHHDSSVETRSGLLDGTEVVVTLADGTVTKPMSLRAWDDMVDNEAKGMFPLEQFRDDAKVDPHTRFARRLAAKQKLCGLKPDEDPNAKVKMRFMIQGGEDKAATPPTPEAQSAEAVKARGEKVKATAYHAIKAVTEYYAGLGKDPAGDQQLFVVGLWTSVLENALTSGSGNIDNFAARVTRATQAILSPQGHAAHLSVETITQLGAEMNENILYYQTEGNDPLHQQTEILIRALYDDTPAEQAFATQTLQRIENGEIRMESTLLYMNGIQHALDSIDPRDPNLSERIEGLLLGASHQGGLNPHEVGFVRALLRGHKLAGVTSFFQTELGLDRDVMKNPIKFVTDRTATIAQGANIDNKQIGTLRRLLSVTPAQIAEMAKQRGLSDGAFLGILMGIGMIPMGLSVFDTGGPRETQERER
ncbi:hypothetical protein HYW55_06020 [Candidatus Gottesmanbacteria bacterium]|nr:hypothetical protein [Candidatus Gottesmanbacteria bacterium]